MAKQVTLCVKVIDGSTFDARNGIRMRLARVNTPRIDTIGAQRAKELLEELILNNVFAYEVATIDDSGHSVAEVWVKGNNVNGIMITAGYK